MTKREREQVVVLLRCAADGRPDGIGLNGMFGAEDGLNMTLEMGARAWAALIETRGWHETMTDTSGVIDERYRHELLEAAARVEEGSWPL